MKRRALVVAFGIVLASTPAGSHAQTPRFAFAGLRADLSDDSLMARYPEGFVNRSNGRIRLAPEESHDHIYAVMSRGRSLEISFEKPAAFVVELSRDSVQRASQQYPPCAEVLVPVQRRYGPPQDNRSREDDRDYMHLTWREPDQRMQINCFQVGEAWLAEDLMLAVEPITTSPLAPVDSVRQLAAILADPAGLRKSSAGSQLVALARELGPEAAPAVPALIGVLQSDGNRDLRAQAALALGLIGPAAAAALPVLRVALQDPLSPVRRRAAAAYGRVAAGSADSRVVTDLMALLADDVFTVRGDAVLGLGALGNDARAAAPALIAMLEDEYYGNRGDAAWALGAIGDARPEVIAGLTRAVTFDVWSDSTWATRFQNARYYFHARGAAVDALISLREPGYRALVGVADFEERFGVVAAALVRVGAPAVPALIAGLSRGGTIREQSAEILREIGTPAACSALEAEGLRGC